MIALRSLWSRVAMFLGLSFYTKHFLRFVRVHLLFTAAVNLSGIFLGIFLLRAGGTIADVCLYYLCAFGFEMAANLFVPWLTTRFSKTAVNRVGMGMYLCSYILLLSLREEIVGVFPVVALFSALGASFYWLPYHHFCTAFTTPGNRQMAMSFLGLLANLIVLLVPLVSGLITSQMEGMRGYLVIFAISAASFAMGIFTSRKLPAGKAAPSPRAVRRFLCSDFRRPSLYHLSLANIFYGVRDGVYAYFMSVLVYERIGSELALGLGITGRSILAVLTFLVMGKILTPQRRVRWNFPVLLLSALLPALLLLWYNAGVLMLVYVADASLLTYAGNSLQFCTYEAVDALNGRFRDEAMAVRTVSLNLGRVLGILGFLLALSLTDPSRPLIWPLVALNGLAALAALSMGLSRRAIAREKTDG